MIIKTAEFEVKPEGREKIMKAIAHFAHAVHVSEPGSKLYLSLKEVDNPCKFLHVMVFENEGAERKHQSAGYTRDFVRLLEKVRRGDTVFRHYAYVGGL